MMTAKIDFGWNTASSLARASAPFESVIPYKLGVSTMDIIKGMIDKVASRKLGVAAAAAVFG